MFSTIFLSIDPNDPNYQNNDNRGRLDASYLKTRHGILKLFELVQGLLITIIYFAVHKCPAAWFTALVSINAFISTLIWLLFYLFNIFGSFNCVQWLVREVIYCGICSLLYFIGSIIMLVCAISWGDGGLSAGTIFAVGAAACYGIDFLLYHSEWRARINNTLQPIMK